MALAIPIPDWNSLDSVRHAHSELEGAALLFFALLVLFDVLAHLSKDDGRKSALEKMALGFFAIAVLAEVIAYPYGQRNDTLSGQMIVSLDEKAKHADSSAQRAVENSVTALSKSSTAEVKAGAAEGKAVVIENRLDSASAKMSSLERDIIAQGPRWPLIDKAAPELIKQLAPFAGQKVDLVICGVPNAPRSLQNEETTNTWASIARILEEPKYKGTNWSVLHGGLTFWLGTLGCAGIYEFVSSEAPQKTMEAAKALGTGLAKALPPSSNKMPSIVDADFSRLVTKRGFESEDAPWHLVTKHPDEIVVWIGPHP